MKTMLFDQLKIYIPEMTDWHIEDYFSISSVCIASTTWSFCGSEIWGEHIELQNSCEL